MNGAIHSLWLLWQILIRTSGQYSIYTYQLSKKWKFIPFGCAYHSADQIGPWKSCVLEVKIWPPSESIFATGIWRRRGHNFDWPFNPLHLHAIVENFYDQIKFKLEDFCIFLFSIVLSRSHPPSSRNFRWANHFWQTTPRLRLFQSHFVTEPSESHSISCLQLVS